MARKKKTATKQGNAIPSGFQAITKQFTSWPNSETDAGDTLQGVVVGYKTIKVKRGRKMEDSQIIQIETDEGVVEVWESAVLSPLFEEDYTEYEVFLRFKGYGEAKKGQNAPKLFDIAYKE